MAFEPGVASARAAGIPVNVEPYPAGAAGIQKSIDKILPNMRKGVEDPDIKRESVKALKEAGIDGRNYPNGRPPAHTIADAILAKVRDLTIYVSDPVGSEAIATATATACLRPGLCVGGGDCDDLTILAGSMLGSVGVPPYAVKVRYEADPDSGLEPQQHIFVGAYDEQGGKIYLDPSTNRASFTSLPSHVTEEVWIDPFDGTTNSVGTVGPTFVTLGAPAQRSRETYFKGGHWYEFARGRWWVYVDGQWGPRAPKNSAPPVGRAAWQGRALA